MSVKGSTGWRSNTGFVRDGILHYFISITDEVASFSNRCLPDWLFNFYVRDHRYKITETVVTSVHNEAYAMTEYTYRAGVL